MFCHRSNDRSVENQLYTYTKNTLPHTLRYLTQAKSAQSFKMQIQALLSILLTGVSAINVVVDPLLDDATRSLSQCNDGTSAFSAKGFKTQGDLSKFPYIAGAPQEGIDTAGAAFYTPYCGACWELSFAGKSITVLAIKGLPKEDGAFSVSTKALEELTGGQNVKDANFGMLLLSSKLLPLILCHFTSVTCR